MAAKSRTRTTARTAKPSRSRSAAKKKRSPPSQNGWGGARTGAGRKKGSGKGPSDDARVARVSIMLTRAEQKKLERLARKKRMPLATLAYELVAAALARSSR